jgi:hypothetical protein
VRGSLARSKNVGLYSLDTVMSAIDGRYEILAHGEREMPVWGEVFKREQKNQPERTDP